MSRIATHPSRAVRSISTHHIFVSRSPRTPGKRFHRYHGSAAASYPAPASSTFKQWRTGAQQQFAAGTAMATPSKIHLTPETTGTYSIKPQTKETAERTSELLQENHEKHHIFFNKDGYHNHIAHHLLTLYGVGAPADIIEERYNRNAGYQRPAISHSNFTEDLSDPKVFLKYIGKEKYYHDYLVFFQKQMEGKGLENVVNEYLFSGSEVAETLLPCLFGGFLHPLIHFGFGLEFQQPAIVCEALAQAAVHTTWMKDLVHPIEAAAKEAKASGKPSKTIPELLDAIRADDKLRLSPHWDDPNKVRDGVMARAGDEAVKYASQWFVTEETLDQKTVEMINSVIYYTAGAQHPPKQVKIDFYYMHCVNSSVFWPTFNRLPWLSTASKVRLLEWKGWTDLAMYASRRAPPILLDEIVQYVPKDLEVGGGEWPGIFRRLWEFEDDGHSIKLGRAVANGEKVSHGWENQEWCKIRDFMWLKIGNMVIDSVEDEGANFVRSAGFEEAWRDFKDRPKREFTASI